MEYLKYGNKLLICNMETNYTMKMITLIKGRKCRGTNYSIGYPPNKHKIIVALDIQNPIK